MCVLVFAMLVMFGDAGVMMAVMCVLQAAMLVMFCDVHDAFSDVRNVQRCRWCWVMYS
jgi:hypothetical protein